MLPVNVNGTSYEIPTMLSEVSLVQYVEINDLVTAYLSDLQDRMKELKENDEEEDILELQERELLQNELLVKMSCLYFHYWTKQPYEILLDSGYLQTIITTFLLGGYSLFQAPPELMPLYKEDTDFEAYELPEATLDINSKITFGEMLDAKIAIQECRDMEKGYWNSTKAICLIFFRMAGEEYSLDHRREDSERFKAFDDMPMHIAYSVVSWFEEVNKRSSEFPVFFESNLPSGARVSAHLNNFGWYNFLKSIANKKVFDVEGMNSLDAARAAKWYDVLLYASEEKMYSEAQYLDDEARRKKK